MKILYLSFYFPPDSGPGGVRNGLIVDELAKRGSVSGVWVVTTMPQRFVHDHVGSEVEIDKVKIFRVNVDNNFKGVFGQALRFYKYQRFAFRLARSGGFDFVFASSSRLGTALLGALISRKLKALYYLDLRDLVCDTVKDYWPQWYLLPLRFILCILDVFSIKCAHRINVLSSAFVERIARINGAAKVSSIYHGADAQFLHVSKVFSSNSNMCMMDGPSKKLLVYAGNFGFGQGLEKFVPVISRLLSREWEIHLYGDGPKRDALIESSSHLDNVKIFPLVKRCDLPAVYASADMLFLCLNDKVAFRKSIPSKIFEYAASGKPVIAICSGQLRDFILQLDLDGVHALGYENIPDLVRVVEEEDGRDYDRGAFFSKWCREAQISFLVDDVISLFFSELPGRR